MFQIMASEIGFEFEEDVLIKCDREPMADADWNTISEFVETTFPLSAAEVAHGFSTNSCMVYLPPASMEYKDSQEYWEAQAALQHNVPDELIREEDGTIDDSTTAGRGWKAWVHDNVKVDGVLIADLRRFE